MLSEIATIKEYQSQHMSGMGSFYYKGMPYWPSMQPSMPGMPPSMTGRPPSMPSMPPTQSHCAKTVSNMGYSHPIGPPFILGM